MQQTSYYSMWLFLRNNYVKNLFWISSVLKCKSYVAYLMNSCLLSGWGLTWEKNSTSVASCSKVLCWGSVLQSSQFISTNGWSGQDLLGQRQCRCLFLLQLDFATGDCPWWALFPADRALCAVCLPLLGVWSKSPIEIFQIVVCSLVIT